jgi:hypothetical protein
MDAVEFLKQFNRMCKAYNDDGCKECPAYKYRCGEEFDGQEEDGVSIIEQWAKEHPVKTRQSEFLKMFPEASMLNDEYLNICPAQISSECRDKETGGCYDPEMDCCKCKRDFWLKEIK